MKRFARNLGMGMLLAALILIGYTVIAFLTSSAAEAGSNFPRDILGYGVLGALGGIVLVYARSER